jgi:hypothetical protein
VVLKLLRKRFRGIAAEMDPHARALAAHHHPKVQSYADALDITSELIMTEFRKRPYSGLLLTAGPPCSPFSSLGSQRGFKDEASRPLLHFLDLHGQLSTDCLRSGVEFRWLLEEVSSMPQDVRETISGRLGTQPLLLNAADFGWVHRSRLYWGSLPLGPISKAMQEEADMLPPGKLIADVAVMRYMGPPLPRDLSLDDGFQCLAPMTTGTSSAIVPGSDWVAN